MKLISVHNNIYIGSRFESFIFSKEHNNVWKNIQIPTSRLVDSQVLNNMFDGLMLDEIYQR